MTVEDWQRKLNHLREDMLMAFYQWKKALGQKRDHLWDEYTKKREIYLRESLRDRYVAIQPVEYFGRGE